MVVGMEAVASTRGKRSRRRWVVAGSIVLGLGVLAGAVLTFTTSFGGRVQGERLTRVKGSPNHGGETFRNLVPTRTLLPGTTWQTVRRQVFGDEERQPPAPIPVVTRSPQEVAAAPPPGGLRLTWLGHSTTLVEIGGQRVLTDPIFSDRCSPFGWIGPQRFFPPPIALADLPPVAAVVISHDHYDHLDQASVVALAARGTVFFLPLAVGTHLERWGVPPAQVRELDWWQSASIEGLRITATPARHFSGRLPWRENETQWASWVIDGGERRVFYSGDTGYAPTFAEIGRRLGPFDAALVKIGAYGETWPEIHVNPEEAVKLSQDTRARLLFPVHWATFNLAFHRWNEPADRVVAAAQTAGVTLALPRPGQPVDPAAPPPLDRWWQSLTPVRD
jgi:L-ascorbate metabolism protein UlaG (beta-lactamase superfamily)